MMLYSPSRPTTMVALLLVLCSSRSIFVIGETTSAATASLARSTTVSVPFSTRLAVTPPLPAPTVPISPLLSPQRAAVEPIPPFVAYGKIAPEPAGVVMVGFYTAGSIYAPAHYMPDQIPVHHLTHLVYAFADVDSTTGEVYISDENAAITRRFPAGEFQEADYGTEGLYGNLKQFFLLKMRNRTLKTMLSIGGWENTREIGVVVQDSVKRRRFVSSAVTLLKHLGFDGLDLSWTFPSYANDANRYYELLRELRIALDELAEKTGSQPYQISAALPSTIVARGKGHHPSNLANMNTCVSFWIMMMYDYAGLEHGLHMNVEEMQRIVSIPDAVDWMIRAGIPVGKLVLGYSLEGAAYKCPSDRPSISVQLLPPKRYSLKELPLAGSDIQYDPIRQITKCGRNSDLICVSYETVEGAVEKATWAANLNMGGASFWQLSADHNSTTGRSIIAAVYTAVASRFPIDETANHLSYPSSIYRNVRDQMPQSSPRRTIQPSIGIVLPAASELRPPSPPPLSLSVPLDQDGAGVDTSSASSPEIVRSPDLRLPALLPSSHDLVGSPPPSLPRTPPPLPSSPPPSLPKSSPSPPPLLSIHVPAVAPGSPAAAAAAAPLSLKPISKPKPSDSSPMELHTPHPPTTMQRCSSAGSIPDAAPPLNPSSPCSESKERKERKETSPPRQRGTSSSTSSSPASPSCPFAHMRRVRSSESDLSFIRRALEMLDPTLGIFAKLFLQYDRVDQILVTMDRPIEELREIMTSLVNLSSEMLEEQEQRDDWDDDGEGDVEEMEQFQFTRGTADLFIYAMTKRRGG